MQFLLLFIPMYWGDCRHAWNLEVIEIPLTL